MKLLLVGLAGAAALALAGCGSVTPQSAALTAGHAQAISYTTLDAVAVALDPFLKDRTIHGADAAHIAADLTEAKKDLDDANTLRMNGGDPTQASAAAAVLVADLMSIGGKYQVPGLPAAH